MCLWAQHRTQRIYKYIASIELVCWFKVLLQLYAIFDVRRCSLFHSFSFLSCISVIDDKQRGVQYVYNTFKSCLIFVCNIEGKMCYFWCRHIMLKQCSSEKKPWINVNIMWHWIIHVASIAFWIDRFIWHLEECISSM